jgi:CHASE3 domain sensor protein
MNIKNLKIGMQLRLGFAAMLFFVVVLGAIAYIQTDKIHEQIETLYNHPLQVRRAIGDLKADILLIQRNMKDIFIIQDKAIIAKDLREIQLSQANGFDQIDILYKRFLGKKEEVDTLKQNYIIWTAMRDETIHMIQDVKMQEAASRTSSTGLVGKQAEMLLESLEQIDEFAQNKATSLYENSRDLNDSLNRQLIFLVLVILLLSLLIYTILFRNIRKPIDELTYASKRFHEGDLNARSSYNSPNEFGELSSSFNTMVEGIHANALLNEKIRTISYVMLNEDDAKKFCQKTLLALSTETNSQMAAIYLLSDDQKQFDHFVSIGLNENARQSFYAKTLDGEFGTVITSKKLQHITNIPNESRFLFNSVSGTFFPSEIITIPILSNNEVIAIISLATITTYSNISLLLVEKLLVTLYARIEGILAYQKMKEF